ncbi:LPS-assembly protein LptD [Ancylobacter sp. 6x-1]|uniref:LPS-assembly protein LptD n=1 Tax=Ancylobacter crimeensis TaxID=2579147 RepID=A0ABT0D665_9HYPH|nr:LPS-assembly protein LptD [Ancylobacter crimeensis]MCK0195427.1 LPS-assembly protein LptD [Ancylobacter crimeensis]
MKVGSVSAGQPRHLSRQRIAGRASLVCWLFSIVGLATLGAVLPAVPALAQKGSGATTELLQKRQVDPNAKMMLSADQLVYDYRNDQVQALGNVQIYYDGAVVEAKKIVYERGTKRLRAEGDVRLTDKDGKVITADNLDLSQDFADGFVNSLRVDTPDNMHFVATQAQRSGGDTTSFTQGSYTPCTPCKTDVTKPPLWQIKAARIIHKEKEQTIYFENASFEFLGIPIAWFPYFEAPDPSVKRKSGFLIPKFLSSSKLGVGMTVPYFWNIAPNMDVTFSPLLTSKQGVLMDAEFRHRLETGTYSIRAAGIDQLDPSAFGSDPGNRDTRGLVETHGKFNLNEQWYWGWDGYLLSDRTFLSDYSLENVGSRVATSQIFLVGQGDRSYFDARVQQFYGLTVYDVQDQQAIAAPVIDYSKVLSQSVFGGQFSYNFNFTNISRSDIDARATSAAYEIVDNSRGASNECNLTLATTPSADCLLRGMAGTYSRLSGQADWRRTMTDPLGQMWTPFANVRVDVASIDSDADNAPWLAAGDSDLIRAMPAVGLEYRYPFISVESWGTQTIQPIAQVVVRPDETEIGRFPNEDAQSLVFDDTNLFSLSKYSGYDRVEGGTRANVGVQYTANMNSGGRVDALFGQSYQLAGKNSYAYYDMANTGADSGLQDDVSDYVARLVVAPVSNFSFTTRYRFDHDTMDLKRFEVQGDTTIDKLHLSALYGQYDPQPLLGYYQLREGVVGAADYKINDRWSLSTSLRYDLALDQVDAATLGVKYMNDCIGVALTYISSYTEGTNRERDNKVLMTITLRTLGEAGFSTGLGSN